METLTLVKATFTCTQISLSNVHGVFDMSFHMEKMAVFYVKSTSKRLHMFSQEGDSSFLITDGFDADIVS